MGKTEVTELLKQLGTASKHIESLADDELTNPKTALLASARFVRPLDKKLKYLKGEYLTELKKLRLRICKGTELHEGDPLYMEYQMLKCNISPKVIADFSYQTTLTAYRAVMEQLFTPQVEEAGVENQENQFPGWALVEEDKDGSLTGRKLYNMSKLLPPAD